MTRVVAMTMKKRKDEVTDGTAPTTSKNAPSVDYHYFVRARRSWSRAVMIRAVS